jgi:choice-of-anchor B domain-containing protein
MRPTSAAFAAVLLLAGLAPAHEDDPKILHLKPAVKGPGYRAAAWGAGQGFALSLDQVFQAEGVTLMAWLPLEELGVTKGNDCWGYTSPSGREYALFGANTGTHVVEITVPSDPAHVAVIPGPLSLWRDIKVYGTRAYAVSEGGEGIQVIDLTNVDAGVVNLTNTVLSGGSISTHNVAIDTESGYLYRCGGAGNGLRIYSLANPDSPAFVGAWQDRYVHDAQVKTFTSGPYAGRQIAFCCSGFNGGFQETGLSIVDVTDKSNPVHVGQVAWPGAAYSHQAWLSEDGELLFVDDELDEKGGFPTTTYVIDVSDIAQPTFAGSFTNGNLAIGHNLYVKGDVLYEANYRSGLRVFDVSDPLAGHEIAYFDSDPDSDGATFNGMWSNYPYFSGGKVIGSDLERGLFVLWVGQPLVDLEFAGGAPALLDPDGATLALTLTEASPGDYVPGTAQMHVDLGDGAVTLDLVDQGGGAFAAELPAIPCGTVVRYYTSAQSSDGSTWIDPPNGGVHFATATTAQPVFFTDDFEADQGWTNDPNDTASDGLWERGEPVGTLAQPDTDHSGNGLCFFTGQTPGSPLPLEGDVDDGRTTLLSPVFDLTSTVNPRISYWRWYSNHKGINPGADAFTIAISGDGGATWTNVEQVGPTGVGTEGGWYYHELDVLDFVSAVDQVRMRFVASDNGAPSTIEAAIDDFRIVGTSCPDCDQSSSSDEIDVAAGLLLDLDQEGTPDVCQPLSADTGELSQAAGGTVHFTLQGGAEHADELYLVLGSLSGTQPGFDLGAVHVPLVQDVYLGITLAHANEPPLVSTFGTLDAEGAGAAELQLSAGQPGLAGLHAHHAWIAIDATTFAVTLASNALPLDFLP